jgi:hypothetical protein
MNPSKKLVDHLNRAGNNENIYTHLCKNIFSNSSFEVYTMSCKKSLSADKNAASQEESPCSSTSSFDDIQFLT